MKQKYQAQGSTRENKEEEVCMMKTQELPRVYVGKILFVIHVCKLKRDKVLSLPQRNGSCQN